MGFCYMFVVMENYLLMYVILVVVSYAILYLVIQSAVLGALRKFNKNGGDSPLERLDREHKAKRDENK